MNALGDGGQTPLHYAARHGGLDTVPILLNAGANPDLKDNTNFSPLLTAAYGREPESDEIVKLLLNHGATLDMNVAVCIGDIASIRAMLETDNQAVKNALFADALVYDAVLFINYQIFLEGYDRTPEVVSRIVELHRPLIDLLIKNGVPVDGNGLASWPALFDAVQMDYTFIARILLEHGANPNSSKDRTNIRELVRNSRCKEEMRALLKSHDWKD